MSFFNLRMWRIRTSISFTRCLIQLDDTFFTPCRGVPTIINVNWISFKSGRGTGDALSFCISRPIAYTNMECNYIQSFSIPLVDLEGVEPSSIGVSTYIKVFLQSSHILAHIIIGCAKDTPPWRRVCPQ